MENRSKICKRLILIPGPFQGHLNPMLQLAAALHSKGFSITVAHSQSILVDNKPPFGLPDFTFFPIPDGLPLRNASSRIPFVRVLNVESEVPLREKLLDMMTRPDDDYHIACVIYDPLMYVVESVVHDLKIPSIVFDTNCAAISVTNADNHLFQVEGYIPTKGYYPQDSEKLLPGHPPFRFKDLITYDLQHNEAMRQMVAEITKTKATSAYILNTIACIEQKYISKLNQLRKPIPVFPIGPLHLITKGYPSSTTSLLKEDTSCITWLNIQERNSVIYVSTGSVSKMDKKEIEETAWGLAQSEQPFLWVIRPDSVTKNEEENQVLPEGFEKVVQERGCVVEWAPQKDVLGHPAVGVFWSHCGWNSTLECICNGVPMICWPRLGDQRINARYVSSVWRIGLELEKMERAEINLTIRNLMTSKQGKEIKERAMNLKAEIQAAVSNGGSSYNSLNSLVEFILSL